MRGSVAVLILAGCGRFGFDSNPDEPPTPDGPAGDTVRITISHNGGDGTVTGPNGFTCAGGECTLDVAPGTAVKLRGLAAVDAWFAGWTGPCGGNFDCELQADADLTVIAEFTPTPNRVFITSTTITGDFGGIGGADAICATRAAAAGLSGTFIAYLSDDAVAAPSRISTSRGWIRTDGAPFADAPTGFSSGSLLFPVRLDEYGNDLGAAQAWTGTNYGAITNANLCTNWTTADMAQNDTTNMVEFGFDMPQSRVRACSQEHHLLCVETGRVVTVATRADTGKRAFVTLNGWQPGGGRTSADAHCASEAALAAFPGTFLAAVATTTESIKSRFPSDQIYRRTDDVRVLRGPGMFTTDWLDVEICPIGVSNWLRMR